MPISNGDPWALSPEEMAAMNERLALTPKPPAWLDAVKAAGPRPDEFVGPYNTNVAKPGNAKGFLGQKAAQYNRAWETAARRQTAPYYGQNPAAPLPSKGALAPYEGNPIPRAAGTGFTMQGGPYGPTTAPLPPEPTPLLKPPVQYAPGNVLNGLGQIERPVVPRMAEPYVNAGNRMAQAMSEFGRSQTLDARAANMTNLMSGAGRAASSVDPLAAKMAGAAAEAAPMTAKMAIRGALTDAAAGAKAVLPVAGKALGVVGTGLDWMDQATDPNSVGNRIAAETKAQADAYMAAHRPAAALAANLWGAGRQAVNLSPVGQVGRLYDAAAPVLKDFAAGLMGAGATPAPVQAAAPVAAPAAAPAMRPLGIPDAHPSRSPVAAAAANAHARMTGQPDFHSTHPSMHSAEDWARANSHLTIGQLKALVDMMPKPRSAKDIIGGHALNALQQQYMQQMSDARSAKSKSFWGNDADAIAAAQRQAHDNYVRALLGLAAPSAMPTAMTLGLPEEP